MAGTVFTIPVVSVGFDVSVAPDCVRGVHRGRITGAMAAARVRRWLQSLAPLRRVSVVSLPIPTATKYAGSVSGVRWDRHDATPNLISHARSAFPGRASAILTARQCSCCACQVDGCARYPTAQPTHPHTTGLRKYFYHDAFSNRRHTPNLACEPKVTCDEDPSAETHVEFASDIFRELEEVPMTIVGGFDVHRHQITFDGVDDEGLVHWGQIRPATRDTLPASSPAPHFPTGGST